MKNLSTYIAKGAILSGDIDLELETTIWFNAVLRGDAAKISIGKRSNVQDLAMIHVSEGYPVTIGENVTIGHSAIIHGCTIKDHALIGMGAIILNGAVIGQHAIIGAGALITEGMIVPSRSLVLGVPGKVIRLVTEAEIKETIDNAKHYYENGLRYRDLKIKIW